MTGLLQRANGFDSPEHADYAVVFPGIWDCVNMRTGGDRGQFPVGAVPTGENISDRIRTQGQAGFAAKVFHKLAPPKIGLGKQHARDHRRLGLGDRSEFIYLAL